MLKLLMKAVVTAIVVPPLVCVPIVGWILIFFIVAYIWTDGEERK